MPRDYARKLEAMRAYAKTEAGKDAKKRSHDRYVIKRREEINKRRHEAAIAEFGDSYFEESLTINPKPLLAAIKHWGTI